MINLNELDEQSKSFFDLLNNNNNRRLTFDEITISNTSKDPFEGIRTNKTARQISNEIALESPFGKRSAFYKAEFIDQNIDFIKLSDFIKKGTDAPFDYKNFIGKETRIVSNVVSFGEEAKYDRMAGIPTKHDQKQTFDAEIPLVQPSFAGERVLQLKGKLYKEDVAIVNIGKDYEGDGSGGLEFEFDYKRRIVNYKIHFYFIGKEMVNEKDNIDNIAFTVSTSNYEDFYAFLEIIGRKYTNDNFKNKIANTFINAIHAINAKANKKPQKQFDGYDFRDLDWLYQNIPYFVAKQLDFDQTIATIFKLNFRDITSPTYDFTAAIISIVQKIDSQKVYDYFYKNPQKLIALLRGFSNDVQIKNFCTYLTAITFVYNKQDIEKARNFALSNSTHIETNILYGDEKGKVELRNELQLPTIGFNGLNLINLFSDDIEINNPKQSSNQFHPLDIIYISRYDENYEEIEKIPSIALYGKHLGDSSEWQDVTDATLAVVDVISILISGGALVAGVRGAARLFAIIDITISTINLAILNPDLRNRLNKTEAGRWFVSHWGIISFCVSLGTISYYLAKGIAKYGKQFRNQVQNQPQLTKQIDELVEESKRVLDDTDLMSKPPKTNEITGGKLMSESKIRKYKGELRQKGIEPIFEDDLLVNKAGKRIQNKSVIKNFKPFTDNGISFENPRDFFYFIRKEGHGGGFHAKSKQLFLTENPTEYLAFHERAHVKHYLEIGDEYHTLATWEKETYVFNEIWTNKHLWTKKELEHALKYINEVRKGAGQKLIIK